MSVICLVNKILESYIKVFQLYVTYVAAAEGLNFRTTSVNTTKGNGFLRYLNFLGWFYRNFEINLLPEFSFIHYAIAVVIAVYVELRCVCGSKGINRDICRNGEYITFANFKILYKSSWCDNYTVRWNSVFAVFA